MSQQKQSLNDTVGDLNISGILKIELKVEESEVFETTSYKSPKNLPLVKVEKKESKGAFVKNELPQRGISKFPRREYLCSQCSYRTYENSNYWRHKKIHDVKKPYSCDKCEYKTAFNANLQKHIAAKHTKEMAYVCDFDGCEYKTADQSNLKKHKLIHGEEKPFKCTDCEFSTANKTAIKNHASTHMKENVYRCDQCKYSTADKYKLTRHKSIHSKIRSFKCDRCEYTGKRKDTLMRHIKRRH